MTINLAFGQTQKATTENGKAVILNPNGTWKYSDAKPTQNSTGDRDKFIGTFTWSGECPKGCFYTHIFQQNGKVKTTFETAESSENNTENWSVDENRKTIEIGNDKWYYKFINGKIKLTSCQYPLDTHELTPKK